MKLIATKPQRYLNRALTTGDEFPKLLPRKARLLVALGRARPAPRQAAPTPPSEDLTALRRAYRDALGKQAYHGWDAATLRRKIAEAGGVA